MPKRTLSGLHNHLREITEDYQIQQVVAHTAGLHPQALDPEIKGSLIPGHVILLWPGYQDIVIGRDMTQSERLTVMTGVAWWWATSPELMINQLSIANQGGRFPIAN